MKPATTLALFATALFTPALFTPTSVQAQDNECRLYNAETQIYFTSDSVELTSQAEAVLDQLVENIRAGSPCVIDTIEVTGHVDWKEIETSVPTMSLARAMTVGEKIVQRGLVTDVIALVGYGARQPDSSGTNVISLERRAEIKITMRAPVVE
jgi:outer membrane protein OmpA-like peptidoglycan-associated protein